MKYTKKRTPTQRLALFMAGIAPYPPMSRAFLVTHLLTTKKATTGRSLATGQQAQSEELKTRQASLHQGEQCWSLLGFAKISSLLSLPKHQCTSCLRSHAPIAYPALHHLCGCFRRTRVVPEARTGFNCINPSMRDPKQAKPIGRCLKTVSSLPRPDTLSMSLFWLIFVYGFCRPESDIARFWILSKKQNTEGCSKGCPNWPFHFAPVCPSA